MKTPVIFSIFNRPDLTAQVFARIRAAAPPVLWVIADGARPERGQEERDLVARTRDEIRVDWRCKLIRDYSDTNLGAGLRLSSGITNAFEVLPSALMLEDDTLPHPDYFPFVDELLTRFEHDKHIWCVSGSKASSTPAEDAAPSYEFTNQIWNAGSATWADRWAYYDYHARYWHLWKYTNQFYKRFPPDTDVAQEFTRALDDAVLHSNRDRYHQHDYQFQYWVRAWGYGALAKHNMITNIGFRPDATTTRDPNAAVANLPAYGLSFPLNHPNTPPVPEWGVPPLPRYP